MEAEIQRKALRRGKNLAFSKLTCLEKERVRSKIPKKSWSGIETEEGVDKQLLGLRGKDQYSDQRSNRIRAPSVASTAAETQGEVDQMARSPAYKDQLTEEGRGAERSLMKREKSTRPRTNSCGTPLQMRKEQLLRF